MHDYNGIKVKLKREELTQPHSNQAQRDYLIIMVKRTI